jgi:5-methylcytosine-specific restriction endonuclease McrA
MLAHNLDKEFHPYPKPGVNEKKKVKEIKGKKHKQTKEKEIPQKVKEAVYERDDHRCIYCNKIVPKRCACCHFIPRSAGGLGIEENIFTACEDCHREQDNGKDSKEYDKKAKKYLKSIYGAKWKIENLIYKK